MNSALQLFDEIDFAWLWVEQVLTTYFVRDQVSLPKNSFAVQVPVCKDIRSYKGIC